MKRRVVVTGMGVLAPNGTSVKSFWEACLNGQSGINKISLFNPEKLQVKIAGEIKNFKPEEYMQPNIYRKVDRFSQLGIVTAKQAIEDAEINFKNIDSTRVGVVIGTGLGGILFHEEQIITAYKKKFDWVASSSVPRIAPNSVTAYIAMVFQIKGPNYAVSTACSSGANAIGIALNLIRTGIVDVCITGGVEAPITPVTLAAYQNLRALSRRSVSPEKASCPFDKKRDGFVISEGSAILILEAEDHAARRNAKIYAEVIGFASNCGAYNMVAPEPEGSDAALAIKAAIKDANIHDNAIDLIMAHGTSTTFNDLAETKAIKKIFGKKAYSIPISAVKSMVGHTIGASGAIGAVGSILAIKHQEIIPTINLTNPDSECDLDYVPNKARKTNIRTVLSNSFGFGSNNAVLVFCKSKK